MGSYLVVCIPVSGMIADLAALLVPYPMYLVYVWWVITVSMSPMVKIVNYVASGI